MIISKYQDMAVFETKYSEDYSLVQRFRGVTNIGTDYNNTINFVHAGLKHKTTKDIWRSDIQLAYTTDEAPPVMINGTWLGANHIFPFGVALYIPNHGKEFADIGSLWQDAEGTKWTLTNLGEESLVFVSENIGESYTKYKFKQQIASKLTHISGAKNPGDIDAETESWRASLAPSIRHTKRKVIAYIDGKPRIVNRTMECDYGEIHEDYEIVNPVSMVEEIRKNRPEGGYTSNLYGAMGETMVSVSRIYRIEGDGTITCDFKIKKHMDIHMERCKGAMFQHKLDTFGGGLYRYIAKSKPFVCEEGKFDLSVPFHLTPGSLPKNEFLTKEFWEKPDNPPDRIVDYYKDTNGNDVIGFACGYLPVLDGVPEIRTKQLESTVIIAGTLKAYPIFMQGDIEECHGIAYRKYFDIEKNKTSVYEIPHDGKTYLYVDLFEDETVTVPINGNVELYEKADGISYNIEQNKLTVSGKGYSMFIYEKKN